MDTWTKILETAIPNGRADIINGLARAMPRLIHDFDLDTPLRQAHFLAQCAHESDGFRTMVERDSGAQYEGRKGLGNLQRGDGTRYKGRGIIQLTGRDNYTRCGGALRLDLVNNPTLAASMPCAAFIAGWYWQQKNINRLADADDVKAVTKAVNGGLNGLESRKSYLKTFRRLLPDASPASHPASHPQEPDWESELTGFEIKAIQQKLRDLGYFEVGRPDGYIGSRTRGALSAFQSNNGLPVTGLYDRQTRLAMRHAPARDVDPARAQTLPEHSRILKGAKATKTTAGFLSLPAIGGLADQLSSQSSNLAAFVASFKSAFMAFSPVVKFWPLILIAMCIYLFIRASGIENARIEDSRTGKTA